MVGIICCKSWIFEWLGYRIIWISGIDALSSNTCVDLCKTKIKPHHEEHLVSKESVVSDTSDNEEKKSKKYWKNFHKNTKNTVTERQLTQDDYLSVKVQNEVSLFRNLIVSEKMKIAQAQEDFG